MSEMIAHCGLVCTDYEKTIDPGGTTTEFIRCPDPTDAGVVAKVTRRKPDNPKEVGWV